MIRGEILYLKVLVFNYMDMDLPDVVVTLGRTNEYMVLKSGRFVSMRAGAIRKMGTLLAGQTSVGEFVIMPTKTGMLQVSVKAQSAFAGDGEIKYLKVKAEGIEKSMSKSALINLADAGIGSLETSLLNVLPAEKVKDSEYCVVQVIGTKLFINNSFKNFLTLFPTFFLTNFL